MCSTTLLHTDEPHPHVHMVVKAVSEQGVRLNVRKATLREWRRDFARHLSNQGIAANATERAVRGEIRNYKTDGIYRATLRGDSTYTSARAKAVAQEFLDGDRKPDPGKSKLIQTRKEVERGWRTTGEILLAQGHPELAAAVPVFLRQMPPPRTEREQIADMLVRRMRGQQQPSIPATR